MSKTYVVWSCAHTDAGTDNDRFDWLGKFIYDIKPDVCIDLGDGADMRSLNSYDTKYPKQIVTQSYEKDIEVYNDSQERLRQKFKQHRKKRPHWVGFEGNHEHRIKTALKHDPRLEGQKYGVSFGHLQTNQWFNDYHEYKNSAPSIATYGGVDFAHYFASGNYGSATSGVHHAYTVINNRHRSSVCGHSHKRDIYFKDDPGSLGMVVGCFKGKEESWAGQANGEWWKGIVVMHDVDNGRFEPQFVSMAMLQREYG